MSDGVALSGNLWLPDDGRKAPALIRFTAYRKDDLQSSSESAEAYFAERGYASALVDLRGLGASSGSADEAISPREAVDGAHVVEWAARQTWCDGNVGVWGMSWGAVTAFRVAAARPPHLRAIAAAMGFLDPYRDWLYPGDCSTCLIPSAWACQHLLQHLMPPSIDDKLEDWLERWRYRLDAVRPYLAAWLEHPGDDESWRRLAIDPAAIEVPTFLIGGWRDMSCQGTVRAYEQISSPKRLLMGPWGHTLPDAAPEWPIDHLAELRRWWDQWLKNVRDGSVTDRPVTLFTQRRATWRREAGLPVERARMRTWWLEDAELVSAPRLRGGIAEYRCDPTVGAASGRWDSLGTPLDQSGDDVRSLTYESPRLVDELDITGAPQAHISVSVEGGVEAVIVLRLCDVAPDGRSDLITSGWRRVQPGVEAPRTYDIELWPTSYAVPAGHRIRVGVSCADFPYLWPAPTNPLIRVHEGIDGRSRLDVPVVPITSSASALDVAPAPRRRDLAIGLSGRRTVEHDLISGGIAVTSGVATTVVTTALMCSVETDQESVARVEPDRPGDASVDSRASATLTTATGSRVRIDARARTSRGGLSMWGRVELDEMVLVERTWQFGEARDAVSSGTP